MILSHYYSSFDTKSEILLHDEDFLTITEYNDKQQKEIANLLSKKPGRAYRRFDNFNEYILNRINTEEWLYYSFINAGGKPKSKKPFYFIVGENEKLHNDFGTGANVFHLDADLVDDDQISFTIGDSMGIFLSTAPKTIYIKSQIIKLINESDIIQYSMMQLQEYHRYIEAQIWDKRYLRNITHNNK